CRPPAPLGPMSGGSLVTDPMGRVSAMLTAPGAADPAATALAADIGLGVVSDEALDRFRAEVAREQLAEWLPREPRVLLDLSPSCPLLLELMVGRGHTVIHAV